MKFFKDYGKPDISYEPTDFSGGVLLHGFEIFFLEKIAKPCYTDGIK